MRKLLLSSFLALLLTSILFIPVLASYESAAIPADIAQQKLVEGNQCFVSEQSVLPQTGHNRRSELIAGQHPFAVIVSCSDSRVPPEIIFNQGLGNLFVVRIAGNVLDAISLGSVEYAAEHLGTKLIVVLGHENCGAVKATIEGGDIPPNIGAIAAKIQPAVDSAKAGDPANIYEAATNANINNMVALLQGDPVLTHITGIKIVGAKYHLLSGEVEFFK